MGPDHSEMGVSMANILDPKVLQSLMDRNPDLAGQYVSSYRNSHNYITPPERRFTVADIEALAKAGVQIKWEDVQEQVYSRDDRKDETYTRSNHLAWLFLQRLHNRMHVNTARAPNTDPRYPLAPTELWAAAYGDKVFVFLATGYHEPCILEDAANMFPSDALLAKFDLLLETQKGKQGVAASGVSGHVSSGQRP